jgi:hypothetical protein
LVLCLREIGATEPRLLRDPKALPFGYIPPEGIKPTPPPVPAAETPAEPGAETKDKEDAAKEQATPPADEMAKPAPKAAAPKAKAARKAARAKTKSANPPEPE